MTKRAAIYCRISKDVAGLGLGVERQERACRELCRRHRLDVVRVLVDNDLGAYRGKRRPGYEAVQEAMKAREIDVLVAWHPDRLTRHTRELEDLIDLLDATDVDVLTVGAGLYDLRTPSGRMQARIVGSVARYESEHKGERQRSKMDELARSGRPAGGRAPYGYRWRVEPTSGDRTFAVDTAEARELRWMAKKVLAGWSTLRIERALNERGVVTKKGQPWHHSTVRAVLVNPAVAGLRVHGRDASGAREVAGPGLWAPIFDRGTWEQVRATIADPTRKRQRPATKHLLSGLVFSSAGDIMHGRPVRGRREYSTAQRRDSKTGDWVNPKLSTAVDADKLESYVVESALVALRDWEPTPTTPAAEPTLVDEIESELAELARLRGERVISMKEWLAARGPLQNKLNEALSRAGTIRRNQPRLLQTGDIRKAWATATIDERRQAIAAVIERITVERATRGRWTTMPERVSIRWRA